MPRNTSRLNIAPMPLRTRDWVLVNECKDNWALVPRSMINISPAQLKVLGQLYDWKIIREYNDTGVPAKMLGTNDSTLNPLIRKGLIKRTRHVYYYLTEMGRRVYDLNYWYNKEMLEARREEMRRARDARQQFMYGGSLTISEGERMGRRRN